MSLLSGYLREVGGKSDDFVSRLGHHAQCVGQRAGRTRGREDVVGRIVHGFANLVDEFRMPGAGQTSRRREAGGRHAVVQVDKSNVGSLLPNDF